MSNFPVLRQPAAPSVTTRTTPITRAPLHSSSPPPAGRQRRWQAAAAPRSSSGGGGSGSSIQQTPAEVEYKDSLSDIAFIALCRVAYGNIAGWQSDKRCGWWVGRMGCFSAHRARLLGAAAEHNGTLYKPARLQKRWNHPSMASPRVPAAMQLDAWPRDVCRCVAWRALWQTFAAGKLVRRCCACLAGYCCRAVQQRCTHGRPCPVLQAWWKSAAL